MGFVCVYVSKLNIYFSNYLSKICEAVDTISERLILASNLNFYKISTF